MKIERYCDRCQRLREYCGLCSECLAEERQAAIHRLGKARTVAQEEKRRTAELVARALEQAKRAAPTTAGDELRRILCELRDK